MKSEEQIEARAAEYVAAAAALYAAMTAKRAEYIERLNGSISPEEMQTYDIELLVLETKLDAVRKYRAALDWVLDMWEMPVDSHGLLDAPGSVQAEQPLSAADEAELAAMAPALFAVSPVAEDGAADWAAATPSERRLMAMEDDDIDPDSDPDQYSFEPGMDEDEDYTVPCDNCGHVNAASSFPSTCESCGVII